MAFALSDLFVPDTAEPYEPFMPVDDVRSMFDDGTQLGIAIGGWGDNAGFGAGSKSSSSRAAWAQNVAKMLDEHGFDFVGTSFVFFVGTSLYAITISLDILKKKTSDAQFLDIDWEYPGGNGADYKQIPNANKTGEIPAFPLLLEAVKDAVAPKPVSIAVPALPRDMMAFYDSPSVSSIWAAVDFVNIMTYDMINRRDTETMHHSPVLGSLAAVDRYLALGLPAAKINLGFAFYAKYFETPAGNSSTAECSASRAVGCPIVKAENDDGSDAGTSGTVTFEVSSFSPPAPPANLTVSPDETCGTGTAFTCAGLEAEGRGCCSQYGWCGSSAAHCGIGCQSEYGTCEGPDVAASFLEAMERGQLDEEEGGMWYWDADARVFWTWDTPELIDRKFREIVLARGLGGVMAWSLAEDSADWSHIRAIADGVGDLQEGLIIRPPRHFRPSSMKRHF